MGRKSRVSSISRLLLLDFYAIQGCILWLPNVTYKIILVCKAFQDYLRIRISDSLEFLIVKRENFNRWYSSGSYYLASVISDFPISVGCSTLYLIIIYVLTDQPIESFRFTNFVLIGILCNLASQSFGILIGALFKITVR